MYVCMDVCVYMYIYIYICTHIYGIHIYIRAADGPSDVRMHPNPNMFCFKGARAHVLFGRNLTPRKGTWAWVDHPPAFQILTLRIANGVNTMSIKAQHTQRYIILTGVPKCLFRQK